MNQTRRFRLFTRFRDRGDPLHRFSHRLMGFETSAVAVEAINPA